MDIQDFNYAYRHVVMQTMEESELKQFGISVSLRTDVQTSEQIHQLNLSWKEVLTEHFEDSYAARCFLRDGLEPSDWLDSFSENVLGYIVRCRSNAE